MKGPFSIFSFFGATLWIDVGSYIAVRKGKKIDPYNPVREVSVIIPIHSEPFDYVEETVKYLLLEKYPIKNIIVCGDVKSDDIEPKIRELGTKNKNVLYIKSPHQSKAKKINYVVSDYRDILGEFVYVRDCRVVGIKNCIETIVSYFSSNRVAAVTSYGRVNAPKNFLSRCFYYGKDWVNEVGRFRKNSQEKRRAVFVICGASTMFRKEVLQKIPMLSRSKTEDTYYTWILQKHRYQIRVADDTMVSAPDVDGEGLSGIKGQIRQSYRWTCGTLQCMYNERRDLFKNKRLAWTTILPGFAEAVMYSIPLVLLPLIFFLSWGFGLGFLIGDTVFSFIGSLIFIPKRFLSTVYHYPQIFLFKYINSIIFLFALYKVTGQAITGNTKTWSNEWTPPATRFEKKVENPKNRSSNDFYRWIVKIFFCKSLNRRYF